MTNLADRLRAHATGFVHAHATERLLIEAAEALTPSPDHADLIGRLEELNRARTQGEWRADEGDGSQHYGKDGSAKIMLWADEDCEHHPVADFSCNHTCRMDFEAEANAAYAAAACNAVPILIAQIRSLTASLSRVEGEARDALAPFEEAVWGARAKPAAGGTINGKPAWAVLVSDLERAAQVHARLSRARDEQDKTS